MGRYSVMVKTQHCGQAYTHAVYEGCDTPYAYVLNIDLGAILNGSIALTTTLCCDSPQEITRIVKCHQKLGKRGSVVTW